MAAHLQNRGADWKIKQRARARMTSITAMLSATAIDETISPRRSLMTAFASGSLRRNFQRYFPLGSASMRNPGVSGTQIRPQTRPIIAASMTVVLDLFLFIPILAGSEDQQKSEHKCRRIRSKLRVAHPAARVPSSSVRHPCAWSRRRLYERRDGQRLPAPTARA